MTALTGRSLEPSVFTAWRLDSLFSAKKMLWQCAPAEAIGTRDEVLALRKQQAKDSHVDACVCVRRFASVCECMARTDCSNPSLEYILPAPAPGPEVLHSLRPCVVLN